MKYFYLFATIAGTVIPLSAIFPWFMANGFNLKLLFQAVSATSVGLFAWLDVLIAAITLIGFIVVDAKANKIAYCYLAIIGTVCVGVSCGLPLYLYLRTRQHEAQLSDAQPL